MAEQLTPLPIEVQLLILASRLGLGAEDACLFDELLRSVPDWEKVRADAEKMGVQALLYRHLALAERARHVPEPTIKALKNIYQSAAFRSLRTQGQIQRLVEKARASGISLILLKGAALSHWIYGDTALRQMSDIDVLCRQEDVHRLDALLRSLGYGARGLPSYSLMHAAVGQEKSSHLPPYDHPRGVRVEVHVNLFGKEGDTRAIMDSAWQEAQDVAVDKFHFLALSNEHMLLHLCLHLHHHATVGSIVLYWFCDLFEFVSRHKDRIDWQGFWAMLRSLRAQNKAGVIFAILHSCWGLPLPPCIPPVSEKDMPQLRFLFDPAYAAKLRLVSFLPGRIRLIQQVAGKYGPANAAFYALRILFPTAAYVRGRYGPTSQAQFFRCYVKHVYERIRRTAVSAWLQMGR